MKNAFKMKLCAQIVGTFLLVISSSFSYGNNIKQNFRSYDITFSLLDLNHSGYLEENELDALSLPLVNIPPITEEIVFDILLSFDTDADGKISESEFNLGGGLSYLLSIIRNS